MLGVFDSQICGGKRYDLASLGRRRANGTYYAVHSNDVSNGMIFAIDLTPLIKDATEDIEAYAQEYIAWSASDVAGRLKRLEVGAGYAL